MVIDTIGSSQPWVGPAPSSQFLINIISNWLDSSAFVIAKNVPHYLLQNGLMDKEKFRCRLQQLLKLETMYNCTCSELCPGKPDEHCEGLRIFSPWLESWDAHVVPGGVVLRGDVVGAVGQEGARFRPLLQDGGGQLHHALPPRRPERGVPRVGVALRARRHRWIPLAGDQHERRFHLRVSPVRYGPF